MPKKTPRPRISGILCGVAGEYLVAAELSRRGYIASLTLRNTKGVDILASRVDARRSVGIQVKASQDLKAEWLLTKSAETFRATNLFYVFVNLNGCDLAEFYVVPSAVVASYARKNHKSWLGQSSRSGKPHRDNPFRKFRDIEVQYRDRWDLLGLDK